MSDDVTGDGQPRTLSLEGPFCLAEIHRAYARLREATASGGSLTLDLAATGPWDLAGWQLLLAADRTIAATGGRLRFVSTPDVCREVAARAGLDTWLQVREAMPPPEID